MKTNKLSSILKTITFISLITVTIACNFNNKSNDSSTEISQTISEKESINDSTVQFLISSEATDFHTYQEQTPKNFRNVKIGYLLSPSDKKQYLLCGEFLSKEKEWIAFATIKTSGYEQYIGNQALSYCNDATIV